MEACQVICLVHFTDISRLRVGDRGARNSPDYHCFVKQLNIEMSRIKNQELSCISGIILDIDHFKSINDTYDHQSGNDILVMLTEILKNYKTEEIKLARYGGEKFVLLLLNSPKKKELILLNVFEEKWNRIGVSL